jgi:ankyrin repeat protein
MLKTDCAVTPLEIAAVCGSKNVVRCILARETDADSLRMQASDSGRIALHAACMNNHVSVAKLLLERKGREQRLFANLEGKLPIHVAMRYGANIDFLPPLLAECAMEQTLAQTKSGMNALMLAAQAASSAAVDMLLAVPGSLAGQLQARDSTGSGAIDHARRSGNAEVIARIEAAMQTLHPVSSTFATRPAIDPGAHPGPVPLTPNPAGTDVADEFSLSDYEEILFKQ